MLTHEIIKYKEKVVAYSSNWAAPTYENQSNIKTNEDLTIFLAQELKNGTFVRYRNGQSSVFSLTQLNVVIHVQTDITKVKIGYTRFPETHLVLQCDRHSTGMPWMRWVDIREYVEISQAEKERFVDAKLLDYIEGVKASSQMYQEATGQSSGPGLQEGDA